MRYFVFLLLFGFLPTISIGYYIFDQDDQEAYEYITKRIVQIGETASDEQKRAYVNGIDYHLRDSFNGSLMKAHLEKLSEFMRTLVYGERGLRTIAQGTGIVSSIDTTTLETGNDDQNTSGEEETTASETEVETLHDDTTLPPYDLAITNIEYYTEQYGYSCKNADDCPQRTQPILQMTIQNKGTGTLLLGKKFSYESHIKTKKLFGGVFYMNESGKLIKEDPFRDTLRRYAHCFTPSDGTGENTYVFADDLEYTRLEPGQTVKIPLRVQDIPLLKRLINIDQHQEKKYGDEDIEDLLERNSYNRKIDITCELFVQDGTNYTGHVRSDYDFQYKFSQYGENLVNNYDTNLGNNGYTFVIRHNDKLFTEYGPVYPYRLDRERE